MAFFLPVTYYSPLVWCYAQLSFHWKSTEQKTFLKVRTCFLILSHGSSLISFSCLKATNIYLLLSFLCRIFKRQMQFTITRYDRARDKTGLKYYVCFFALLVDSGFFEGVKKVLHVGEVGLFRYFRVIDLMPSCYLFSVKFFVLFSVVFNFHISNVIIYLSFFFSQEQKELVDPYLVFSFAGRKVKIHSKNDSELFRTDVNFFPKAD